MENRIASLIVRMDGYFTLSFSDAIISVEGVNAGSGEYRIRIKRDELTGLLTAGKQCEMEFTDGSCRNGVLSSINSDNGTLIVGLKTNPTPPKK